MECVSPFINGGFSQVTDLLWFLLGPDSSGPPFSTCPPVSLQLPGEEHAQISPYSEDVRFLEEILMQLTSCQAELSLT